MFNIHGSIFGPKSEEPDERRSSKYIDGLMEAFAAAPEAQPIIQQYGRLSWVALMMDNAIDYMGANVPDLSASDFDEILFELFPRKISTPAESADEIIAELRAFWRFVQRQYQLPNAEPILALLDEDAVSQLRKALSNPANFGMAKSFLMQGEQAGFDMTTQEGIDAFMVEHNSRLFADRAMARLSPIFDVLEGHEPISPERRHKELEKKRKARKAQRQARKRNRK